MRIGDGVPGEVQRHSKRKGFLCLNHDWQLIFCFLVIRLVAFDLSSSEFSDFVAIRQVDVRSFKAEDSSLADHYMIILVSVTLTNGYYHTAIL